ncbi:MAG TPA: carbohydrate kinase family protein [Bryobacteraceae bacterium]|nr:carbohydrate kinase family protein [Bryobacteraceae bacterium]
MAALNRVLCCGNVVFDIAVWPVDDLEWNTTQWVESITESLGGNGANTSYTLATMGVPVRLISRIGDDERGARLASLLQNVGVDVSGIEVGTGTQTSTTVVLAQRDGARKFYHRPGASRHISLPDVKLSAGFQHFHLANPFALRDLREHAGCVMQQAREAGMTTSIDTGWDSLGRWMEDLAAPLEFTDWLFVNDSEERMLGGTGALRTAGARHVVVKTGAQGCIVDGQSVPGFSVNAVDSTGAGDCFAGAFLAGLMRGLDPLECARIANATGALNVSTIGAVTGVMGWDETLAWMQKQNS